VRPRRPPAVGQHSDEVLREAGYDAAMIAKLRTDGAVA
jgi:crotonobetainyl-CoA:carnitine CoA-transferase CaiB-like acyl-CoA transferase